MRVVHLMASPFLGGPERQALGLARHLPSEAGPNPFSTKHAATASKRPP